MKLILLAVLTVTAYTGRIIPELWGYYTKDATLQVSPLFEGNLVDGFKALSCQDLTVYNLSIVPGLTPRQQESLVAHCHRIFLLNSTATFEQTVYNISKLKGFGHKSAHRFVALIKAEYDK